MRVISYYWIHPDDGMPQIDKTERSKESSEEKRRRFYVTDKRRKNMKNSNLFKKFATIVMAAMMVLSTFAMPTFAANDTQVAIDGVEAGATVTLYKVVKDPGNGKWTLENSAVPVGETEAEKTVNGATVKLTDGIQTTTKTVNGQSTVSTTVVPSAAKITAIADSAATLALLPSFKTYYDSADKKYKSYTADDPATDEDESTQKLTPGVYVAVVTGVSSDTIYNPMVVSMDYDADNTSAAVDADSRWDITNVAYAKKSTPGMKKTTLDHENRYADPAKNENPFTTDFDEANDPVNDRNVGADFANAVIPYKVVTTIPSYSETFTNPRFFFKDALQDGFEGYVKQDEDENVDIVVYEETTNGAYKTLVKDQDYWFIKINNDGTVDKTKNTDTTSNHEAANWTNVGKQQFALEFKVNVNDKSRNICILYKAQLVDVDDDEYMAGINPYTNEAYIEWSKNPSNEDEYGKDEDCTHHYTFDIDGNIGGEDQGEEIIKVGVDEAGKLILSEKELKTNWTPLPEAEFKIYKQNAAGTDIEGDAIQTIVTNDDGQMPFRGLDAGKYFIKETKAPEGYALNETKIPVVITPVFTEKEHHGKTCHIMTSYTININGYENTYTLKDDGTIENKNNSASFKVHAQRDPELKVADEEDEYNSFTAGFVNTKTGTLPSTGGIGTVVFTVGGIAIMALALFLLFGAKKKEQE